MSARRPITAREVWQREDFAGTRADAIRITQRENAQTDDLPGFGLSELAEPDANPGDHPGQLRLAI